MHDEAQRIDALVADMTARLRPLCAEWPEDVFTEMVRRLAEITVKYEGPAAGAYDRGTTDRLLSDMRSLLEKSEGTRQAGGDKSVS